MESYSEQLSRVRLMSKDNDTWDLSDNDQAALKAVIARLDLIEGALADQATTACSWCGHKCDRADRTSKQHNQDVIDHVLSCDKRPEGKLMAALLAIIVPLGIDVSQFKVGDTDAVVAAVEARWKEVMALIPTEEAERGYIETQKENERLRAAVRNQCGDNLCWLEDPEVGKALSRDEFLKSCARYYTQIAGIECPSCKGFGVPYNNCGRCEGSGRISTVIPPGSMTIAQLEAECERLRGALLHIEILPKQYPNACDAANTAIEIAHKALYQDLKSEARNADA